MSFKQRNTIVLLIQTLLVCTVGAFLLIKYYPDQMASTRQELDRYETTLAKLPEREDYLAQLEREIEESKIRLSGWNKSVEATVSMAGVLDYLNRIQEQFGSMKFTLTYVKDVNQGDYGYKVFTFSGEADWSALFALIWSLENGPKIYAIEKLSLRGVETMEEEEEPPHYSRFRVVVPFNLQIRAVYASCASLADFPSNSKNSMLLQIPDGINIFYPAIIHNLPPNDEGFLEAERAELKAIFPAKAIIADHLGNIHSLTEGDPVYLGYLLKINQPQSAVEFLLNKGGIVEKLILKLNLESSNGQTPGL
jgi:hypothetical protein